MSLDAIRAKAKPAQKAVTVFLDGEIAAEIERRVEELNSLDDDTLGGNAQRDELATELEAAYDRARDAEETFVFQAVGASKWKHLMADHPAQTPGEIWDNETFPRAAISASLIGPKLTEAEVQELEDILSPGQFAALWSTCQVVNLQASNVPKSARPSGTTRNSGPTRTTAARAASRTPSS